jgi:hypothetical protein
MKKARLPGGSGPETKNPQLFSRGIAYSLCIGNRRSRQGASEIALRRRVTDQDRTLVLLFAPQSRTHIFVVTGSECDGIATIKCQFGYMREAIHEFGMAGAVKFLGLVKSPGLVVGSVDAGERRKYRGLVPAVPPVQ